MNGIMTCILPLIFSVPLVMLLAGGMTALANVLEGAKNSDTLYSTTANDMICSASEDASIHGTSRSRGVTSRAGISPPLPSP